MLEKFDEVDIIALSDSLINLKSVKTIASIKLF